MRLRSADPADKPVIQPNYLSTDEDRQVAADSIRVARRIVAQPALQPFQPVEYLPGAQRAQTTTRPALAKAAGDIGTTIFHPVGTAKMGRNDDPMAVVDERLRVIGLDNLRVIDASVMPTITSGNTNSPTMMIAEKGAMMVRGGWAGADTPSFRRGFGFRVRRIRGARNDKPPHHFLRFGG